MNERLLSERLAVDVDAAFPAIVRAHQDRVYSLALRLTGDGASAEELAHDVFVRAYGALTGYSTDRRRDLAVRPWLATITLNAARNAGRRRPTVPLEVDRVGSAPDPGDVAATTSVRRVLAAALAELPDPQRHAVLLRHVTGMPYAEIAATLERPVGTVKADVHRGLAALRALLDEEDL